MNRWIDTALDFAIGAAADEENMFGRSPFPVPGLGPLSRAKVYDSSTPRFRAVAR